MIVAGHQPQYIPHIGFFNKISKADVFVIVDNVQFSRKSWQQRTLIKRDDKELCLTIPALKKGKAEQLINQVEILNDGWQRKHWKSICLAYEKSPYFYMYKDDLESFYTREWTMLAEFTEALLRYFIDAIGIKFKAIYLGSQLGIQGEKTSLLIDICIKTGCDTYLSGSGAKAYLDEQLFLESHLEHRFNEFTPVPYKQHGHSFLPGMGIIDAMFMYGPNTIDLIMDERGIPIAKYDK